MAPKKSGKSGGNRGRKRRSDTSFPSWVVPAGIGVGMLVLALLVLFMIPWGGIEIPGLTPTHDTRMADYVAAWKEYEQARSSAQDAGTARNAVPKMRQGLERVVASAESWIEFAVEHPIPANEALQRRVDVQNAITKVRQEFPENRKFWASEAGFLITAEDLSDLLKRKSEVENRLMTTALAGDQAADSGSRTGGHRPMETQTVSDESRPTVAANRSSSSTAPGESRTTPRTPTTSPATSVGPPETPPAAVEIPRTALHQEFGDRVVNIRILGLDSPQQVFALIPRFTAHTDGGNGKSGGSSVRDVHFSFVGPVADLEAYARKLEPLGKVVQVDPASRLIVLWISQATKGSLPRPRFP